MGAGQVVRERKLWARGPAKVPPGKDFPPIGWGTHYEWKQRLQMWRSLPAKERRSYNGARVTRNPEMQRVVVYNRRGPFSHDLYVFWSEGDCFWPDEERAYGRRAEPRKRGFWLGSLRRAERYLGEDIEAVKVLIRKHYALAQAEIRDPYNDAEASIASFETSQPILDRIASVGG